MPDALARLVRRYAATHGPFTADDLRARYGVDCGAVLAAFERGGELVRGELRPGGTEREWCDPEVLRRLRRASLAVLRKEVEPVDPRALARFLPAWQGVDRHPPTGAGVDRLREVLVPLQGLALPVEVWERDVLPRRIGAYSPAWMDQLCASGELVWIGAGALGRNSGRVVLYFREDLPVLGPPSQRTGTGPGERGRGHEGGRGHGAARRGGAESPAHDAVRARLAAGACFFTDLLVDVELAPEELQEALWDLAWAGEATNDAFAPLARAAADAGPGTARARPGSGSTRAVRGPPARRGRLGAGPGSLVADRAAVPRGGRSGARRRAIAELLLERYGILTREQVRAEGLPGGFSASTRSSRSSRRWAWPGAATSSRVWAAHSSRSRARSSGCAR